MAYAPYGICKVETESTMTPVLRWLIWLVVLIVGYTVALDWQVELSKLRLEHAQMERQRQREENANLAIDWVQEAKIARQAQLAWLNRLPEVVQMGVFRAEAMESMSDLCQRLSANCQVAAMGETSVSLLRSNLGTPGRTSARDSVALPGLVSTSVRVTVNLAGDKLMPMLRDIETGPVLRKIEKFSARGGRADMVIKTFGIESQAAAIVSIQKQIAKATASSGENKGTP